jgi:hypothetical protein
MDGWFVCVKLVGKCRHEHKQEAKYSLISPPPLTTKTRVVDRFMKNILKYVEDGMDDV